MINQFMIKYWNTKVLLNLVIAIQLALWGAIGLDSIGLNIPIIRQVVAFIYLFFVPGFLILRLLKLHELGIVDTFLYTIGLSIAALMCIGFLMNSIYPIFGFYNPISIGPLIITISAFVLILCFLCYAIDRNFADMEHKKSIISLPPLSLFFILIPFLSIFGTYLANFYHINILLMVLIITLGTIVIAVGFDKIDDKLYPLVIFTMAISLLYHKSLISTQLYGTDIHNEFYLSNSIIMNGIWLQHDYGNLNGMLSLGVLAPIISIILNISVIWTFKIIFTLIFSLVPLGLYWLVQKQIGSRLAFFSSFFFMSVHMFYTIMLEVARQQIAELFLVLLIALMVDKNMDKQKRSILFIIFSFSLITAHYGLSYMYMFSIIITYIIVNLVSKNIKSDNKIYSMNLLLLFIVFALAWYMHISSSSIFISIVHIGEDFASSLHNELFDSSEVEGRNIITRSTGSILHSITKYLHIFAQICISIGVISSLLESSKKYISIEYLLQSSAFYLFLIISIIFAESSINIGTSRAYFIALIFLAPFFTIGYTKIFGFINYMVKNGFDSHQVEISLSIFLAIFLLFNSGFIYELAKDDPTSIALNSTIGSFRYSDAEANGAYWLGNQAKYNIYSGDIGRFIIYDYVKHTQIKTFMYNMSKVSQNSFIFLSDLNLNKNKIVALHTTSSGIFRDYLNLSDSIFYNDVLINSNIIYSNGNASIYRII